MSEIKTIGLDLAKHVFQIHGVDAAGECVLRKRLRRGQVVSFSPSCRAVWLGWKPARRRTTGRENWRRRATRSGLCQRST